MSDWNSEQYLKFKNQRTQPALDLVNRIKLYRPNNILDIGCGPGNSSKVLRDAFPNARILGIDSSENMIKKAKETYLDIDFKVMDISDDSHNLNNFDIIFSNACLQWVDNHRKLIPMLFSKLNKNGVLAVQIPMNSQETLFKIVDKTIREDRWNFSSISFEPNTTLSGSEYFDILSSLTDKFDIWETVYYHNMPSIEAMIEWIKGSRLNPYLNALNNTDAQKLIQIITERASDAYIKQENGEIIFKFKRFFFTAVR